MTTVIFVHGISNKPSPDELLRNWRNDLATDYRGNPGLDLGTRARIEQVYWADVFYKEPVALANYAESSEMALESAVALQDGGPEVNDVREGYLRSLAETLDFPVEDLRSQAPPPKPAPEELAAAAAEAIPLPWFLKKPLMQAFARDSHHYLFNKEHSPRPGCTYKPRDEIRSRFVRTVKQASKHGPVIVLSHSMGTVIAYDCLKNVPDCPLIEHLMTVGSPLGLSEIQDKLDPGYSAHDGFPHEKLRTQWANVYDPVDIVSRADPRLRNDYLKNGGGMVEDIRQKNDGAWTHSMSRYAAKQPLREKLRELIS